MRERRALAGLWGIQGIGSKTLRQIEARFSLAELCDRRVAEWWKELELPKSVGFPSASDRTLGELGDEVVERARAHGIQVAFRDEPRFPARLKELADAPPMLFYWGPGTDAPPRRRVAMVGARHPDTLCVAGLSRLAAQVAEQGIGIVSGAAMGIDTLVHQAAVRVKAETWGFVGSALDQLDRHPAELWLRQLRDAGATLWSELPCGVRAERRTFPRRNRLISGAADAVAVLRGDRRSGTRYTAHYALAQGRPLLAWPGEPGNPMAELALELIHQGKAQVLLSVDDVMRAVGVSGLPSHRPRELAQPLIRAQALSADAQATLARIAAGGTCFDELMGQLPLGSGQLLAALAELTRSRLVVEHTGRRYQKL